MENTDKKLAMVPTNDESCVTFVMNGEGHTIGQPLHQLINLQKEVSFCGFSVPHILEKKINFRIQTKSQDHLAIDSLKTGLENFKEICMHIQSTFDVAVKNFSSMETEESD